MNTSPSTLGSYILGFALSTGLTLGAFWAAAHLGRFAVAAIVTAALVQLLVQLVFFLHMGSERKPQWRLLALAFTAIIVGIVAGGTLWIMHNLAHLHMPPPMTTDLYQGGAVAPQNELK